MIFVRAAMGPAIPIATPMLLVASQISHPIPDPALAAKRAVIASERSAERAGSAVSSSALLGGEFRSCIGLEEPACRTTKDPHRDALVRRNFDLLEQPAELPGRPLNPGADDPVGTLSPENEPLHHLAVTLEAPIRFDTHIRTSDIGTAIRRLPPTNDYANPVVASELPIQRPVTGNSGSAFCSSPFSRTSSYAEKKSAYCSFASFPSSTRTVSCWPVP